MECQAIRKANLENLIGELKSISHNVKKGTVCCLDCGSKNISYTNGDISFDISNTLVRNEIVNSIENQIEAEKELIDKVEQNISILMDEIKELEKRKQEINSKNKEANRQNNHYKSATFSKNNVVFSELLRCGSCHIK